MNLSEVTEEQLYQLLTQNAEQRTINEYQENFALWKQMDNALREQRNAIVAEFNRRGVTMHV